MAKKKKKRNLTVIKNCGGKKGKGCSWAGATKGETAIKIAA